MTRGYDDYVWSDALNRDRGLTQTIAGWAHERGYQGNVYHSRFGPRFHCWAVFESVEFGSVEFGGVEGQPITPDDPDVSACAALFDLTVP